MVGFASVIVGPPGAALVVALTVLASAVAFAATAYAAWRVLPMAWHGERATTDRSAWIASGGTLLTSLVAVSLIERVDTVMLGTMAGPADAGLYSAASRLALLVGFAIAAVNALLGPMCAELHARDDWDGLRQTVAHGTLMASGTALVLSAVLLLFGRWLLHLFGPAFPPAAGALSILVLGQLALAVLGSGGGLLAIAGRNRVLMGVMVTAALADVALCFVLIPTLGMNGAATATLAAMLVWGVGLAIAAPSAPRRGCDAVRRHSSLAAWTAQLPGTPGANRLMGPPRRTVRGATALMVCLLTSWLALADTLLRNGDFKQGGLPPAGWFLDPDAAGKGSVRLLDGTLSGDAGSYAGPVLELAPTARNTPGDKPLAIGQLLPTSSVKGQTVIVTARLSAEGGAHAVLGLAVLRKDGVAASLQLRDQGEAFALKTGRMAVPSDYFVVGVVLFLVAEGTAGFARFADIGVATGGLPAAELALVTTPPSKHPISKRSSGWIRAACCVRSREHCSART